MTTKLRLWMMSAPLILAGCGFNLPQIAAPAPAPAPPARPAIADIPTATVAASGAAVRSVIAQRAAARGTRVASNTPGGIVLERLLAESTEIVVEQCGAHKPGRLVRIVVSTRESGGRTVLEERRFIVDGTLSCQLKLTADEIDEATKGLEEVGRQASGRAA